MRWISCLSLSLLFGACLFSPSAPEGANVTCASDLDCPSALPTCAAGTCRALTRDTLAQGSLSAELIRPGQALEVQAQGTTNLTGTPTLVGPPFDGAIGTLDDDRAVFALVLDEDAPDGNFDMSIVGLVGADGRELEIALPTLTVDGTPPVVSNIAADREIYSDLEPEVIITFETDEPLDGVGGQIGQNALACEGVSDADLSHYQCTGTIDPERAVDGRINIVQLVATDAAGNQARDSVSAIVFDVDEPTVSFESITFGPHPSLPDASATVLHLGADVEIEFSVSEALVDVPVVVSSPVALDFEVALVGNLRYRASATLLSAGAGGPQSVRVAASDLVGHSVDVELLTSPELSIATVVPSPCVAAVDGAAVPTDFDGDGFFGVGPGCIGPECIDCDDIDAAVYPGALELPGDLKANDCTEAGDFTAPDESVGVFLSPFADGDGDGTRAAPFRDLWRAIAAANDQDKDLYIASGAPIVAPDLPEPVPPDQTRTAVDVSFFGGFDANTWTPSGTRSQIDMALTRAFSLDTSNRAIAFHMIDLSVVAMVTSGGPGGLSIVDASITGDGDTLTPWCTGPCRVVRSTLNRLKTYANGASARVVGSSLGSALIEGSESTVIVRSTMERAITVANPHGAPLYVISSINLAAPMIRHRPTTNDVVVVGSMSLARSGSGSENGAFLVVSGSTDVQKPHAMLINNVFIPNVSPDEALRLVYHDATDPLEGGTFEAYGNALPENVDFLFSTRSSEPNIDNGQGDVCPRTPGDHCLGASDNIRPPALVNAGAPPTLDGAALQGRVDPFALVAGLPTAAAADFNGNCRASSSIIGPYAAP